MREHFTVHLTDDDTISPRLHTQCGEVAVVETGDWVESVELANFVALACNSHYAMLAALEEAVDAYTVAHQDIDTHRGAIDTIRRMDAARAAIAQAKAHFINP